MSAVPGSRPMGTQVEVASWMVMLDKGPHAEDTCLVEVQKNGARKFLSLSLLFVGINTLGFWYARISG